MQGEKSEHGDMVQMGEGHVAKGGDNTMVWEKLLPTFDFSFHADSADSKPLSARQSPPIHACSFFPFFPFIQTCQLQCHHCCHLHLNLPSHASQAHTSHPTTITLTVPSAS